MIIEIVEIRRGICRLSLNLRLMSWRIKVLSECIERQKGSLKGRHALNQIDNLNLKYNQELSFHVFKRSNHHLKSNFFERAQNY